MPSTAGRVGTIHGKVRVIHPFHPLSGQEIDAICRRLHWGEDRVVYSDKDNRLCFISAAWTDIDLEDEFRRIAGGRAAFRTCDLLALHRLLDDLTACLGAGDA
jgi:Family of unknown function (DUF5372)